MVELRTILVTLIGLSLMTVPASAGEDGTTLSCTVLLGAPGFVADTPAGGIGGCILGEGPDASVASAALDQPVGCSVEAEQDPRDSTAFYVAHCDAGVVFGQIAVTFTYRDAPGSQIMECDDQITATGCSLGTVIHDGHAAADMPRECRLVYDADGDGIEDGEVEDDVSAGWEIMAVCDLGVVLPHITLTVLW